MQNEYDSEDDDDDDIPLLQDLGHLELSKKIKYDAQTSEDDINTNTNNNNNNFQLLLLLVISTHIIIIAFKPTYYIFNLVHI